METEIRKTVCGICSAGCGVDAHVKDGRLIRVEGDADHPASSGALCGKGRLGREFVYHPDRIQTPLLRRGEKGGDDFAPISWDEALDRIAERLLKIKAESGPESVVFFTGYPKWLRPFLKRLAHGFGSPNYCSESSTCFFATVMASRLNYGSRTVPDLRNARCILNWSSNPYHGSVGRIRSFTHALKNGVRLIDVGPLETPLSKKADLHLRIRPGTSGALALAMAHVIIAERLHDEEFVENWSIGFESFRNYVETFSPRVVQEISGVQAEDIIRAARMVATNGPAAMINSASVTVHHTNGVQNHRAITALIGLTGNFDRKGGNRVIPETYYHTPTGLISRESAFEQVRSWEEMAPRIGAEKFPVWASIIQEAQSTELPLQIQSNNPYPVRAMVAFGLNHRMWPGSDAARARFGELDFLVDADLFLTDSAKMADIVLPVCSTFERDEVKITSSRYAVWTRPAIDPVGESRSDIDIIAALAKRLVPDDPLLAKGYEACLDWMFEPAGFTMADIQASPDGSGLGDRPGTPYEKYRETGFATPSGKMEFSSSVLEQHGFDPLPAYREPLHSPVSTPDLAKEYPLVLTTGARLTMLMHSRMYRMGAVRNLRPGPVVDISPKDAANRGIVDGNWVRLRTPRTSIRVRAHVTERVPAGVANIYHGDPKGDANELIDPEYRDPISGYPGYKSLLCEVLRES